MDPKEEFYGYGIKLHSKIIQVDKLKGHHIRRHYKEKHITWQTVLMLIQTSVPEKSTIVIDSQEGIFVVKQTIKRLFKQLDNIRPIGRSTTMKRVAHFNNIKEYIPYVFLGLSLSPTMAINQKRLIWFASEKVTHCEPGPELGTLIIRFGDFDLPIQLKMSHQFLQNRQNDAITIQKFGKLVGNLILMSVVDEKTPYTVRQLEEGKKMLEEFQHFARKLDIEQAFKIIGYQATDEEIERIVKKIIGN